MWLCRGVAVASNELRRVHGRGGQGGLPPLNRGVALNAGRGGGCMHTSMHDFYDLCLVCSRVGLPSGVVHTCKCRAREARIFRLQHHASRV